MIMRWQGRRQSQNVEDRRSMSTGRMAATGGIGSIVMIVIALLMGVNTLALLQQPNPGLGPQAVGPADEELKEFVSVVLADTEEVWHKLFRQMGRDYEEPTLVLFRGRVESACGLASSAVGPFYCPRDHKVYVDLQFFEELRRKFGAPGDFAQAYVIAHEVGHHVQELLGTSGWVQAQRGRLSDSQYNRLSVRLELQADFLAGVWAHHAQRMRGILEPGDIDEAIRAAEAIGDDRLQKRQQGYVVPDSFTHGTSEQRAYWFRLGLETGDVGQGDTFNAEDL
jgi:predicted metalloprotease